MAAYQITLKNEKTKQYDRIALFILLINFALFVYIAISTDIKSVRIATIMGASLIILAMAIDFFLVSIKNNEGTPYRSMALYAVSFAWMQMEYWWIAILCLLLGTLYFASKRKLLVSVLKDIITYPSFPRKNIGWAELNSVVIKDGLLTINFKNDRFIQQFIDETKTVVNEQEFNDFCIAQLRSAN